ncbi:hypothetical protein KFU94_62580 [Chloroflexi bacterium TSY]|nr:hypothetical protein [Chloroflexi bacterium TSY]
MLDWSIDINAPTDRVNDQPVHWYITPYYEGVTLGFEDDIPAAIIATLAYIHAHFASRLEDLLILSSADERTGS